MPKIKVEKLTKVFGKHPKQAIELLEQEKNKDEILQATGMTVGVNQATFDVEAGEVFVIMGLSGSGKSTLIRLINRLIEPTMGSILIDNDDLSKMNKAELRETRRKKLGMVFQKFALFPHKTILANAEYGLEIQGLPKQEREEKAKNALDLVGLGAYLEKYPDELSGGMQQRVGLARALANDPDVLLMDEAFSALDPLIRKDMQDELLDLQQKMQKTIVFITHDLDEALRIGDRIALMKDGSIVQIGTPEEIMMSPANDYVERFVEDVDRSKVFTAEHVMKRPETINGEKAGPRVALQRIREAGISSIFVTNNQRQLMGYVTAEDAARGVQNNLTLKEILSTDAPVVAPDTSLNELFETIYDSPVPLAVVRDDKLIGIVIRGAVLAALAGSEVGEDDGMDTAASSG
ncbi:glycine betaine/L-proline ABC transporter ATP-binding protein [Bacillaceae bacterium SIJ1]|uniref:quaternary amine ABC transporter ATP-binding protein n=1 Tax=Litoribacterium kuwaitense TaxID=1398745 RepID=UPI0013EA7C2D|nr:glycine betaine/L-proline ABC transporter ATP-binding protein [Litoribacterium kuwaitense]NGP43907.1 glycine betaine/L-proline ABC transporter ATP-binding protein [Litoribacterium kuwaitense]